MIPEAQKLIHRGKALALDKTIADFGIKDGDSIVLMINKVFLCLF